MSAKGRSGATTAGQVFSRTVTLERRRKTDDKAVPTSPEEKSDEETSDKVKATSEEARRDASERAAELLARLRKL